MRQQRRLRLVLIAVGISFIAGLFPLINVWPDGFRWRPEQPEYEQMIAGIYAVLGVFLIRASRDPSNHLSLIWFTVWSSLVHAVVMGVHAMNDPAERGHLVGDIPALAVVVVLLATLTPRAPVPPTP